MDYLQINEHTIRTTESETGDDGVVTFTRECECGWWTTAQDPEPAHHDPLADREAAHLAEVAAIADGTIWNRVPDQRRLQLSLRRRASDRSRRHVALVAVWMGGFQTVMVWPWTEAGLTEAQEVINRPDAPVVFWDDTTSREGRPVQGDNLADYAR